MVDTYFDFLDSLDPAIESTELLADVNFCNKLERLIYCNSKNGENNFQTIITS